MRPAKKSDSPPQSLVEMAAYLRGVADATAALSEAPASPVMRLEAVGTKRATIPYEGGGPRRETLHAGQLDELPSLESLEEECDDARSIDEPFTEERPSHTRLRVAPLSAELYELLGLRAG